MTSLDIHLVHCSHVTENIKVEQCGCWRLKLDTEIAARVPNYYVPRHRFARDLTRTRQDLKTMSTTSDIFQRHTLSLYSVIRTYEAFS